jgi:hypothetical protein
MLTYASIANHPVKRFIPGVLIVYLLSGSAFIYGERLPQFAYDLIYPNRIEAIVLGVRVPPHASGDVPELMILAEDGWIAYTRLPENMEVNKGGWAVFDQLTEGDSDSSYWKFVMYLDPEESQ